MYQIMNLQLETKIYRIEDGAVIPMNEANSDYQQYLAWVAEGNTAEEWRHNGN
jgi:hypothetical protein